MKIETVEQKKGVGEVKKCPYCFKNLGLSVFHFKGVGDVPIPGICRWCNGNLIIKWSADKVRVLARKSALTILLPSLAGVVGLWLWAGGVQWDTGSQVLFYVCVLPTPFIFYLAYVRYKSAEVEKYINQTPSRPI